MTDLVWFMPLNNYHHFVRGQKYDLEIQYTAKDIFEKPHVIVIDLMNGHFESMAFPIGFFIFTFYFWLKS